MADQFTYAKLPSDPCLTQEQITAYLDGKLSAADQYACEKHFVDCAMCEDALEGLALVKDRSVFALPLITEASAPKEPKIIPLQEPNRRKVWYAVAAILVLVLGSTFVVKMMDGNGPDGFAQSEDVNASPDSFTAPSDKYSLLESEKATDSLNYQVTTIDGNGTADLRQENKPAAQKASGPTQDFERDDYLKAPDETKNAEGQKLVMEETHSLMDEDVQAEEVLNETVDVIQTKEKTELAKQEDKKTNFWNRASFDVPSGNAKADNAGTVEQQTLTNQSIAGNTGSGTAGDDAKDQKQEVDNNNNAQSESPKVSGGMVAPSPPQSVVIESPKPVYDRYTDSGVVYANTVNPTDTTAVDQLEMSYINGINLAAAGQANAAITMFDKVLLDKNHPRYEDAEFQKAKALIKANKKEEAKTLLKSIELKKGKHAAEATELLKTL